MDKTRQEMSQSSDGTSHGSVDFLKSSLIYRQEENETKVGAESTKNIKREIDKVNDYFRTNPFTQSPEPGTAPEPAKNPYDENAILTEGDNPPNSDDYLNLLRKYQQDIENMVRKGARPYDIVDSGKEGFVDTKKSITEKGNPVRFTEAYISQIRAQETKVNKRYKGMSIRDIVTKGANPGVTDIQKEQVHRDLNVLSVMAALSLKNVFKMSDEQLPGVAMQIKDIYIDHARQGEIAKVAYEYYTLQLKKKNRWHDMKILHKDLYYTLSISKKHDNRRYKKDLTLILGKEKERRDHLVEKYPKILKNKRGKREREKIMLDELIQHKEDYKRQIMDNLINHAKVALPYDRIMSEMEKVFGACCSEVEKSQDPKVKGRFQAAMLSFGMFKDRVIQARLEQTQNLTADAQIDTIREIKDGNTKLGKSMEKFVRQYGAHPSRSWANDIASEGGILLTAVGTIVGWVHVVPLVGAAS